MAEWIWLYLAIGVYFIGSAWIEWLRYKMEARQAQEIADEFGAVMRHVQEKDQEGGARG